MNDRAPIRDRTLALRILVPRLADRLREKMKEVEDMAAREKSSSSSSSSSNKNGPIKNMNYQSTNIVTGGSNAPSGGGGGGGSSNIQDHSYWDLDGVSCEPTAARNRTLWNFHCDGATYPARLVNLPCPVEIHKTFDHASYYKSCDVAQLLIVYEDDYALEEAEETPPEGFESYYHSGLTPPMKRVVERRFAAREHKAVAPPRAAVADVEEEILQLMKQLQKDEKGAASKKDEKAAGSNAPKRNKGMVILNNTKVLEEVEEVVVPYEAWMDDGGKQPDGVEFNIDDPLATTHPEIFLSPTTIEELREQDNEAQKKRIAAQEKKDKARKEKKKQQQAAAAAEEEKKKQAAAAAAALNATSAPVTKKKGIANRKQQQKDAEAAAVAAAAVSQEDTDEAMLTQAATAAMSDDFLDDIGEDDLFADINFDEDDNINV